MSRSPASMLLDPTSLGEVGRSDASLRRFLHGLPGVDQVGAEARARRARHPVDQDHGQGLRDRPRRSRMIDLTTLEGADTPGKVRSLCAKARPPRPADPTCPPAAAVCVYGDMVAVAVEALGGSGRARRRGRHGVPERPRVARGQARRHRRRRAAGADEIDMVIDRGAFLSGRYLRGLRRDRAPSRGGLRTAVGAPQGDPRDRRAADLRQRAARVLARDARGRRLHQDLDRQGRAGRDARRSRSSCSRWCATAATRTGERSA